MGTSPKTSSTGTKPAAVYRSGNVSLAVFSFPTETKDGKKFDSLSFAATRSYKNADGSYKFSTFLQPKDLLVASQLMLQAWKHYSIQII